MNDALREVLDAMDSIIPQCEWMHHEKKDQGHFVGACPVEQRFLEAREALRAALAADERERSAPASREQMEAFAARLKAIIDDGLRRQSEAAPDAPQAEQPEPVSNTIRTAPKRIWLNVFTDEDDADFPSNHEGITWCEDEVGDADVQYIRADLAAPQAEQPEPAGREDAFLRFCATHCSPGAERAEWYRTIWNEAWNAALAAPQAADPQCPPTWTERDPLMEETVVIRELIKERDAPQAEQPGFIAQIAATKDSVGQWPEWMQRAAITADAALPESQAEQRALENCRMFAARHRKEYWAQTILRFCADGGATGSPLRGAQPDASISVPQAEQPEPSAFDTLPDDYETGDY